MSGKDYFIHCFLFSKHHVLLVPGWYSLFWHPFSLVTGILTFKFLVNHSKCTSKPYDVKNTNKIDLKSCLDPF